LAVAAEDKECGTRLGASCTATGKGMGECTHRELGGKARAEE